MAGADTIQAILKAAERVSAQSSDFDLNPQFRPAGVMLRPAAVLIPLIETTDGVMVILTKRASHLKHHPGQIAFPGGKIDAGDKDAEAAAMREAHEEIGLEPDNVVPLIRTAAHETVTGFLITPVLAQVRDTFQPVPEPGEVEEVFQVPLPHITDVDRFSAQWRMWQGQRRAYYTVPYGPYYIWGATARILRALAEGLAA